MRDDGVDETSQESGVDQIRNELSAFSDGATGDSSGSDGEGPLVEEMTVIKSRARDLIEAKEMATDEAVGRCSEGESVAEEVVEEPTGSGVKNVGKHYVHGVFGSD